MNVLPVGKIGVSILVIFAFSCTDPAPRIADLAFHRGQNALDLGRYDWARVYFEQDLEMHPDRAASMRGLGLGWLGGHAGSLTHGMAALESYLETSPDDLEIRLRLVRSLHRFGENGKAKELLRPVEHEASAAALMAELLETADPEGAERWLGRALRGSPGDAPTLLLAARLSFRRQDCSTALGHAEAAVAVDPLELESYYLLGQVRRCLGDLPASERAFETYRLLTPLNTKGQPSRLSAAEELQVLRSALATIEAPAWPLRLRLARLKLAAVDADAGAAVRQLIDDPDADALALLELGRVAQTKTRTDLARSLFRRALELEPNLKAARARWARLERHLGQDQAAGELVNEGLEAAYHHAPYHFVDGLLKLDGGDAEAAARAFETALELAPWLADYRLALADVYLASGHRSQLQALLESAPTDDPQIVAYRQRHVRP